MVEILLVIESDIATTFLLEQILGACAAHGIATRKKYLSELDVADIGPNTIPLIARSCDPSIRVWIDSLIEANHPYIYYIDDNFWQLKGDFTLAFYYQYPLVRDMLDTIVRNASLILTNTHVLADFMRTRNPRIEVLPTFFDFDQIKDVPLEPTDELRIGFAGSLSRAIDLEIVKPLIDPILQAYPRAVFEFAGGYPADIAPRDRVRIFDYQNSYTEYIRFQVSRQWLIGLAPLLDTESNRCKTDNKYREYCACGIVGVYSDILPYRQVVQDGVTGLMVENTTRAWMAALTALLDDIPRTRQMAKDAATEAREQYCVTKVALAWSNVLQRADIELRNRHIKPILLKPLALGEQIRVRIGMYRMLTYISFKEGGIRLVAKRFLYRLTYRIGLRSRSLDA